MKQQPGYLLLLLFLLTASSVLGQYKGGSNDGQALGVGSNQPLGRNIFRGGVDDGHTVSIAANQPLGRNIFRGGNDDGHTVAVAANQGLGRNIFRGGNDDGHAVITASNQPLGRNIFQGGVDDGHTVAVAPGLSLGRNIFRGGSNDGWAMAMGGGNLAVPLPITLVSFTGRWQQQHGLLVWQTATEISSASFDIQRSYDGSSFTTIGSVAAAGQSSVVRSYQHLDSNQKSLLPQGVSVVYYRLRSVDVDGKFDYSGIVILRTDRDVLTQYSLYPNPARDVITVATSDAVVPAGTTISLADATGRVLRQERMVNSRQQVNISDLPTGNYFLRLTTGDKILYTQKLIITK